MSSEQNLSQTLSFDLNLWWKGNCLSMCLFSSLVFLYVFGAESMRMSCYFLALTTIILKMLYRVPSNIIKKTHCYMGTHGTDKGTTGGLPAIRALGKSSHNTDWPFIIFFFKRTMHSSWLPAGVPIVLRPFTIGLEDHFELVLLTLSLKLNRKPDLGGTVEKAFLQSTSMTRTSSSAEGWVLSRQILESCLLPGWMGFWTRGRNRGAYQSYLTG